MTNLEKRPETAAASEPSVETTAETASSGEKKSALSPLTDNIFMLYFTTLILFLGGQILGTLLEIIPFMTSTDGMITATLYLEFIGIWIVGILYLRLTGKNRPILKAIGTATSGNSWQNLLIGTGIGVGLNCLCILVAWLHGDISMYYDSFQPVYLVIVFLAIFVQSSAEELLCRGFLYQRLRRCYQHPAVAIAGNSLLFALLHLANDGVTGLSVLNIFIVGIFFSLMVYYMDSLWCAMAAHAAWNFTQNIIFGLPNSGIVAPFSIFRLDASAASDSFAYNVGFGIEGTFFADAVLIVACIALCLWGKRYGKKPYDTWANA